jgi:hypothetical protein
MTQPQYKWTNDQGEWVHTFNPEIANKALFHGNLVERKDQDGWVEVINHYDIFEEHEDNR